MNVYCGIDFGTTNTVVSLAGREGQIIDFFSIPTALFIPLERDGIHQVIIGTSALEAFKEKKAGRYIHSLKRSLSDSGFTKTRINNRDITMEDLVALFLEELRKRIYDRWGISVENAAVGRPVRFSLIEEDDKLAFHRLKEGFRQARFRNLSFLEEPIAASYCFEEELSEEDSSFLIMDYGGGTSDYSLISHHPSGTGVERYRVEKLDGVDMGGDHFDEVMMLRKICPFLAMGATYESYGKRMAIPVHIYNHLCRWNNFIMKDKKELNAEFHDYRYGSSDPEGVERLFKVISERQSFDILEGLKKTKHGLTESDRCTYHLDDRPVEFRLDEYISLTGGIRDGILQGLNRIREFAEERDMTPDKIILTGGSSRNRSFLDFFSDREDIFFDKDHFYSISKGLALYGHHIGLSVDD